MRNNFFQFNQDQDDSFNELFTNFNPSLKRNLRDFNYAVTAPLLDDGSISSERSIEETLIANAIIYQSLFEGASIGGRSVVDYALQLFNINDKSRDAVGSTLENITRGVAFGFFQDRNKGLNYLGIGGALSIAKIIDSSIANSGRNSLSVIFENSRIGKIINTRFNSSRGRLLKKFLNQMIYVTSLYAIYSSYEQNAKNSEDKNHLPQSMETLVGFINSVVSATFYVICSAMSSSLINTQNNNSLTNARGNGDNTQASSENNGSEVQNRDMNSILSPNPIEPRGSQDRDILDNYTLPNESLNSNHLDTDGFKELNQDIGLNKQSKSAINFISKLDEAYEYRSALDLIESRQSIDNDYSKEVSRDVSLDSEIKNQITNSQNSSRFPDISESDIDNSTNDELSARIDINLGSQNSSQSNQNKQSAINQLMRSDGRTQPLPIMATTPISTPRDTQVSTRIDNQSQSLR
jgi:hypothetical protein